MADYKMPSLGADMDTGTLLEWKVKPGDTVRKGQIVAIVDTEKASLEIEIFFEGVVEELLVHAGEKVAVGVVIARVRTPGEAGEALPREGDAPLREGEALPKEGEAPLREGEALPKEGEAPLREGEAPLREGEAPAEPKPAGETHEPVAEGPAPPAPHVPHVTPVAKKIAAEKGVDISVVRGSGIEGAVTRADVEKAATGAAPPAQRSRLSRDAWPRSAASICRA